MVCLTRCFSSLATFTIFLNIPRGSYHFTNFERIYQAFFKCLLYQSWAAQPWPCHGEMAAGQWTPGIQWARGHVLSLPSCCDQWVWCAGLCHLLSPRAAWESLSSPPTSLLSSLFPKSRSNSNGTQREVNWSVRFLPLKIRGNCCTENLRMGENCCSGGVVRSKRENILVLGLGWMLNKH